MTTNNASDVIIYQSPDGKTSLDVRLDHDTVWLSQAQMVSLFNRDQSVISRHLRNAFSEGELDKKSNMQKMHFASSDKPVVFYSLDVIISVGYRVKSQQGTRFRQWATQVLKDHIVKHRCCYLHLIPRHERHPLPPRWEQASCRQRPGGANPSHCGEPPG